MKCSPIRCFVVFLCLVISACSGGNSGNSSGSSGGGSSSTSEYLLATGGVDLLVLKVDSRNANLSVVQTVPTGGDTSLALNNPPIMMGNFVYAITPLTNGINAYSMSSGGTLTAVSGSPFLVPQNVSSNPQLGSLMGDSSRKRLYALNSDSIIIEAQADPTTGAVTFGSASVSSGFLPQYAVMDPAGKSIYVSESVAGFVATGDYAGIAGFSPDPSSETIALMANSPFQLASNSQPCGIVIDPAGRFVYSALVNANGIAGFSRDASSGTLTPIAGSPFPTARAPSQTCFLATHPSGKFLYALNLNDSNFSGYSINTNSGALTDLPGSPFPPQSDPNDPSHIPFTQGPMAIDPSGKYLFVLTSEHYIAVYSIDQTTGSLSILGSPRSIPMPVYSLNVFQSTTN